MMRASGAKKIGYWFRGRGRSTATPSHQPPRPARPDQDSSQSSGRIQRLMEVGDCGAADIIYKDEVREWAAN